MTPVVVTAPTVLAYPVAEPGTVRVLGLDPGLAHMGAALFDVEPVGERLVHLAVFETSKAHDVLASGDAVRRCRELWAMLWALAQEHHPRALCVEAASWPRDASSSAKTGMARGLVAALAELLAVPIVEAAPMDVKSAATGRRTASKLLVEARVCRRYPEAMAVAAGITKGRREHCFDAAATVVACLPRVRALLAGSWGDS